MRQERSILAGGCFWGMQDLVRKLDGVITTRVGYAGGDVANATYCRHGTHAEAIEIVFDADRLSFRNLLEFFFQRLEQMNWREVFGDTASAACSAPAHPQRPELGTRAFGLGPALWIERDNFAEIAPKGFFRLFPGNKVRLKYGVIIACTGCIKDAAGHVTAVQARVLPDTRSGTPGA